MLRERGSKVRRRLERSGLDLWNLHDLDTGRALPCASIGVFLAYLHSPGTLRVEYGGCNVSHRFCYV